MAVVTGLTAARMKQIEAASVVGGSVVGNDLILTKKDSTTINAGNVRGASGLTGPIGPAGVNEGDDLQAGVVAASDCLMTVNSISQVTVAAGIVWVKNSGGALVRSLPASTILSAIPVSVNNRIDQIIVSSSGVISRLQGTSDVVENTLAASPQVGGGRAAIPAGSRLLYDMQITSAGVLAANVRDRRPWARGAYNRIVRNANAAGTNDYTPPGAPFVDIDSVNLGPRIECSGVPLEVTLKGRIYVASASGAYIIFCPVIDGVFPDGIIATDGVFIFNVSLPNFSIVLSWTLFPTPGSHKITWRYFGLSAPALFCRPNYPVEMTINEVVRQNTSNGV